MTRRKYVTASFLTLLGFLVVSPLSHAQGPNQPMDYEGTVGGLRNLEEVTQCSRCGATRSTPIRAGACSPILDATTR
jgi:hypothetical protein